jgi:Putative Actinobacterial Holin-X, holin superfamily III
MTVLNQSVVDHCNRKRISDLMEQSNDNADAKMDVKVDIETEMSVREHVSALISSARELVDVEIDFYRTRLTYSQQVIKRAGLFGIIAISFLFAAIVALVLGILLILAKQFSPETATLAVTIGFIFMAGLFGWLARINMRKLSFPELSGDNIDDQG